MRNYFNGMLGRNQEPTMQRILLGIKTKVYHEQEKILSKKNL